MGIILNVMGNQQRVLHRKVTGTDLQFLKRFYRDFPGGLVVKTSPSNAGNADSIPGHGAKIHMSLGQKNQNIKQKQCCNKFNKDFKMLHIKI